MKGNQPNVLFIISDQMAAPALPIYGHKVSKAPNLEALAARSVVFDNAYCNFPVCAPSRFSFMTGMYATRIGTYDNGSEFPASRVTLPYYLRDLGYHTSVSGKMHFIGPDQFHGYEQRLTTDIIGSDFALTADWASGVPSSPAGATLKTILDAGHCIRSLQIDYDDEVEHCAVQKLYDLAREPERSPFFLTVSFTHPHAPFTAPIEHWERYRDGEIDLPKVGPLPDAQLDMMSRWLAESRKSGEYVLTEEIVRNARHAYYAMISYIDDKVGRLLEVLRRTRLDSNTMVVFIGDHGEMMGERGMWFKSTFYEWSCRVPFLVSMPGTFRARREARVASLVDLMPTLLELCSGKPPAPIERLDGHSLIPLLEARDDGTWPNTAISEYTADGVCAPCRMVREGRYKYIYVHGHGAQLYDMERDPLELANLAGLAEHEIVERRLRNAALAGWDPEALTERIMEDQRRRLYIQRIVDSSGQPLPWSYSARGDDASRYVRGAKASEVKARRRFPYVGPHKG